MDIESAIKQYLNLKNRLIPSTETEIYTLKRGIPKKVKSLKKMLALILKILSGQYGHEALQFLIFFL